MSKNTEHLSIAHLRWKIKFKDLLVQSDVEEIQVWIIAYLAGTSKVAKDLEVVFYNSLKEIKDSLGKDIFLDDNPSDKLELLTNLISLYDSDGSFESFEAHQVSSVGDISPVV